MNWFRRKTPEFLPNYREPKKPESLHSLSEKIIMRQMKKDPEFGLTIAQRVKNVAPIEHAPEKSLQEQIAELRDLKEALGETFGEQKDGAGGIAGMVRDLIGKEGIQLILGMIASQMQQPQTQQQPQPQTQQITPAPTPIPIAPPP